MRNEVSYQKIEETHQKLKLAFADLRKQGLIAKMNFMCCGSCAGDMIASQFGLGAPDRRAKTKGAIFYDRQANRDFREDGMLYINYGDIQHYDGDKVKYKTEIPTVEIGKMVAETLRKHEIYVEWGGDPDIGILIHADPSVTVKDDSPQAVLP